MAAVEDITCDHCGEDCTERHATLRSLEHVIRDLPPQWRVDLCARCYLEFRNWLREGVPEMTGERRSFARA